MVRTNKSVSKPLAAAEKSKDQRRTSGAERSAYFARREAAKVLRSVLQGDARRRAVGSIKSLVYSPSVRNKKATFALVCQTLKYLPIIRDLLNASSTLNSKWKRQQELMYIITYDILFGKENLLVGDAEKFLMCRKDALESALARYLVKKKVKHIEELIALHHTPDDPKPRYVRVNTLKLDVDSALVELSKHFMNGIDWSKPLKLSLAAFDEGMFRHYLSNAVQKDGMVPHLLVLPPGSDVHDHPLVKNGSVILQGKASSMVAAALDPKPGWDVLDACSAPGNKTVHLAALMRGKGRIIACEMNKERVKRLEDTVRLSGATNIEVLCGDFLSLDPKDPSFCKVRAIIVDPSCSGSGTTAERLDHLLPSHAADHARGFAEIERLDKLAAFQRKALAHALSFPAVERVVYSTCSVHQTENEDVVSSILPLAVSNGFQLATPFPQWHRRGLPVFEGSEHLLRTDPVEDKEGFFIALFVKNKQSEELSEAQRGAPRHFEDNRIITSRIKNKSRFLPGLSTRLSNMWFPTHSCVRKRSNNCSNEE